MKNARFLVVDGNSRDETVDIAKIMGAEVIFQEGSDKWNALLHGLTYIDYDCCDYVVLTDADYTCPTEYVPAMT